MARFLTTRGISAQLEDIIKDAESALCSLAPICKLTSISNNASKSGRFGT